MALIENVSSPRLNVLFDEQSDTDVGIIRGRVASIPEVTLRKEFLAIENSTSTSSRKGLFRGRKRASTGSAWWAHNDRSQSSRSGSFSSRRQFFKVSQSSRSRWSSSMSTFRHPWTESACGRTADSSCGGPDNSDGHTEIQSRGGWLAKDLDATTLGSVEEGNYSSSESGHILPKEEIPTEINAGKGKLKPSSAVIIPVREYSL